MTEALQQLSQVDLFSFLIILFLIITIFVSAATLIGKASEIHNTIQANRIPIALI